LFSPTQKSNALAAFNAERNIFFLQPFTYDDSIECTSGFINLFLSSREVICFCFILILAIPQGWADTCPTMHNPNRGNLGENIFLASSSSATVVDAINLWNSGSSK
jgi:hypothetical protein